MYKSGASCHGRMDPVKKVDHSAMAAGGDLFPGWRLFAGPKVLAAGGQFFTVKNWPPASHGMLVTTFLP